ncbi:A/G-specific adenine glycosylase [Sulfobacillus thermosulfidooxidans]|uniref:A/G-specific adenine glycosylase n=1 Tax=Sulfobacillus thermosulfidooxidans TaxID=28034 RepID=UPI0006B54A73|nr:A/G-specific adenine glycosylase [Sulfobacillus thermosulfidooxidans]
MKRIKYHAVVDSHLLEIFQTGIQTWYQQEGRDLPWRHTTNPYHILVSEILLHQTTVKTVEPVYRRFLERFPTVTDLANASLAEVKTITDPLGYKIRGQWLHQIAQAVVSQFDGVFPRTLDELLSLPGIGRYTAGAIMSFAFGYDAPILDTNVNRLIGRYFAIDFKDSSAETKHQLWSIAEAIVPPGQAREFNNALMDMGAMVCTARKPKCLICPVAVGCAMLTEQTTLAAEERVQYRLRTK